MNNTGPKRNNVLKRYLEILCKCYSTGRFDGIFPFMSEDCIFDSQWVFDALNGKNKVIRYLNGKGETLRKHKCCPTCMVVRFTTYPAGKFAMLMIQTTGDEINRAIVDLQLDENDLISRIDLCIPQLYKFENVEGPFTGFDATV